jgi:hypothetical protein
LRNDGPKITPITMNPTTWGIPSRWNSLLPKKETAMMSPTIVRIFGSK